MSGHPTDAQIFSNPCVVQSVSFTFRNPLYSVLEMIFMELPLRDLNSENNFWKKERTESRLMAFDETDILSYLGNGKKLLIDCGSGRQKTSQHLQQRVGWRLICAPFL